MVLSMSNTNQPHLPQRITVTMKFNFNSIFYVRYKSEEISPLVKPAAHPPISAPTQGLSGYFQAFQLWGKLNLVWGRNFAPNCKIETLWNKY